MTDELLALSPLDGRYASESEALRQYLSEFAFIRGRVAVEIAYLMALSREAGIVRAITQQETQQLEQVSRDFSLEDARENKDFERITRHDVKGVESFLRARLQETSLADLLEYLHFGLTSEDVNNIATGVALRESRDHVLLPAIDEIIGQLAIMVRLYRATPMLARTHGQAAVPTTFGKELSVFLSRLKKQRKALAGHRFEGKLNGAVGNFNALVAAAPQVDWPAFSERFVESLGLEPAEVTTQILPYDNWVECFDILKRTNAILIGMAQDLWSYASLGYVKLKVKATEAGSSTMPQKVNPVDLENAEGNLGVANALMEHYGRKLLLSRLQRDLSDSTVRRTFGTALGHSLVGYKGLVRGLALIEADAAAMRADLEAHWEVIAEGAQTMLRAAGVPNAYDVLKELTRGKGLTEESYKQWVETLEIDEEVKTKLRQLSPLTYAGLAEEIAERALREAEAERE